jgi:molybdopterin biosynthesis enzyme
LPESFAVLAKNTKGSAGRDSCIPGKMGFSERAQLLVEPVEWGGSSDFVSFAKADCLIFVLQNESLAAGEIARILHLP